MNLRRSRTGPLEHALVSQPVQNLTGHRMLHPGCGSELAPGDRGGTAYQVAEQPNCRLGDQGIERAR
jgi:hypothetical protein